MVSEDQALAMKERRNLIFIICQELGECEELIHSLYTSLKRAAKRLNAISTGLVGEGFPMKEVERLVVPQEEAAQEADRGSLPYFLRTIRKKREDLSEINRILSLLTEFENSIIIELFGEDASKETNRERSVSG